MNGGMTMDIKHLQVVRVVVLAELGCWSILQK